LKIRKGRITGNALIVLGVILVIVGLLMPYYKIPQRLTGIGPKGDFSQRRPYWVSTYITPPIDKGTPINLNLLSDKPGATAVLLAPFDPQMQMIEAPPVINTVFGPNQNGLVAFAAAIKSAPYMLMITSYNSSFQFQLDSVWSPFYELRASTTFGLATIPLGLAIIYYDGIVEKRERMFEEALKGIRKDPRH